VAVHAPTVVGGRGGFGADNDRIVRPRLGRRKDIRDVAHRPVRKILTGEGCAGADEETPSIEVFARRFFIVRAIDHGERTENCRDGSHAQGAGYAFDSIGMRRVCAETKRKQYNGNSFHDQMPPSMCRPRRIAGANRSACSPTAKRDF